MTTFEQVALVLCGVVLTVVVRLAYTLVQYQTEVHRQRLSDRRSGQLYFDFDDPDDP